MDVHHCVNSKQGTGGGELCIIVPSNYICIYVVKEEEANYTENVFQDDVNVIRHLHYNV